MKKLLKTLLLTLLLGVIVMSVPGRAFAEQSDTFTDPYKDIQQINISDETKEYNGQIISGGNGANKYRFYKLNVTEDTVIELSDFTSSSGYLNLILLNPSNIFFLFSLFIAEQVSVHFILFFFINGSIICIGKSVFNMFLTGLFPKLFNSLTSLSSNCLSSRAGFKFTDISFRYNDGAEICLI